MDQMGEIKLLVPGDKTQEIAPPFSLTTTQMRSLPRVEVIRRTVDSLDRSARPSLDQVQALFCRCISDEVDAYEWDEGAPELPWPQGAEYQFIPSNIAYKDEDYEMPIQPGVSRTFPEGLQDYDESDGIRSVAFEAIGRLSPSERDEAVRWFTNLLDVIPLLDMDRYINRLYRFIYSQENNQVLFAFLMDYIYDHRSDFSFSTSERLKMDTPVEMLVSEFGYGLRLRGPLSYLANHLDEDKGKRILGMVINTVSYPEILNEVRRILEDKLIGTSEKEKLERLGRFLLGADPDNQEVRFFTRLDQVYAALETDFQDYVPNLAATEDELKMLREAIAERGIAGKQILDLACGTGRHANGLAEGGIGGITGLDINPKLLAEAYEQSPKEAVPTPTGSLGVKAPTKDKERSVVGYTVGDMYRLPLADGSKRLVSVVGRCFSHVETERNFRRALREVHRVLEDEGVLIFDFPKPNQGTYLANRQKYIGLLRSVGVPVDELGGDEVFLRDNPYIVDGPKGEKLLYNRYTPDENAIMRILGSFGFEVSVLKRSPIADADGQVGEQADENIYFQAVKRKTEGVPLAVLTAPRA